MTYEGLKLTDISPQGEGDYWWPALPTNTDKEKPYIRPVKIGTTRYLAIFDIEDEAWHYVQFTNV
jgi:hypothetical protein